MAKYRIQEVVSKADEKLFLSFQDKLYKGNKYRVPQLHISEKKIRSPKENPAFEYSEMKSWLVFNDKNKPVGRISGIISHESNKIWKQKHVRFAWLDFIEDEQVLRLLIQAVEDWAKSKGLDTIHGPMGFCDMDMEGILVEGFEELGTQATLYNYPYYPQLLEKIGFKKDVDWVQHEIKVPKEIPERVKRISQMILDKYNLHILKAKKPKDLLPYAPSMFRTYNKTFAHLYGFTPLTEKQIEYYTKEYVPVLDPRFACFVLDENDEVVGFGISIISLSKALQKAKGKLFPFGFLHILKALKTHKTVDLFLQGVLPKYIKKGVIAIFYNEIMQAYIDNGITTAVTSHILELNKDSHQMFDTYETRQHIRRRAYIKKIEK